MKLKGYSNYEIYPETGQVWSYYNNMFIGTKDNCGYLRASLQKDEGGQKHWRIHRLIWTAVNGSIPEGLQVNHIDENKENNSISNLNLMTLKENCNWGTRNRRCAEANTNGKCSKPILGLCEDKIMFMFPSASEAGRHGFKQQSVSRCASGERNHYKNYKWQYLDDYLADWLEAFQNECLEKEKAA